MKKNYRHGFYIFTPVITVLVLGICVCESGSGDAGAEKMYLAAVEAYTEEQYGTALEFIKKVQRLDRKFYQAGFLEAKILFFQGKEAEAETQFLRLSKKYPSYTEARIWYIRCLIISGKNEQALSKLEEELS
jgi:hypothetical protein